MNHAAETCSKKPAHISTLNSEKSSNLVLFKAILTTFEMILVHNVGHLESSAAVVLPVSFQIS